MNYFKKNWIKNLFQWGVLITIVLFFSEVLGNEKFDPEAYCPFGGLQTLATYLTRGSMACSMTMVQIMIGVTLAIGVILFGKLFCGYVCPLGLVNELFVKLRRQFKIKQFVIANGSVADKALRSIKYILLFLIFYMTLTDSELFCKNFDPYYAFATGFKGELTVWMACISISVLFLCGLLVDMFWCRYICPLGALSNLFKFTLIFLGLLLIYAIILLVGIDLHWVYLLASSCILGYYFEAFRRQPKYSFSMVKVCRDSDKCNNCTVCAKRCPYQLDVDKTDSVKSVDCTLCGECIASCKQNALSFNKCKSMRYVPAILVAVLFALALYLGQKTELPTIDVTWDTETVNEADLKSMEMNGLYSVKCFGSSMAFKAQASKIVGVYGVKTFVKVGRVELLYNPKQVSVEEIEKAIFTPSKFRVNSPASDVKQVKKVSIRTENMHDKMDANYLGMQLRLSGKKIYGIQTQYDCPIEVIVYMDVNENITSDEFESLVEMETLKMPLHGGGTKEIKCNYDFVELEEGSEIIEIRPYLEVMFDYFKGESKKNIKEAEGKSIYTYEIADAGYEKPILRRGLPYLSNHLTQHKGILGVYLILNNDNLPALQIKYNPEFMNEDKLWALMTQPTWKIQYKVDDIREEKAKIKFTQKGNVIK